MERNRPEPLRLEELRRALNKVLDNAVEQFGPTVSLDDAGYYWHLSWDTAYAFDDDAGLRLGVGDTIQDDVVALQVLLQAEAAEDQSLSFDLGSLAELLRWLAFQDSPRQQNERRAGVTDEDVLRLLRQKWRSPPPPPPPKP